MLLGNLSASLLGNLVTAKDTEQMKAQLEHASIFNAIPSFT